MDGRELVDVVFFLLVSGQTALSPGSMGDPQSQFDGCVCPRPCRKSSSGCVALSCLRFGSKLSSRWACPSCTLLRATQTTKLQCVLHDMCLRACHSRSLKTSLHVRSAVECANGNLSGFCVSPAIFPAQPVGHQIGGTLLAFLVVFRSQIALNMYLEGRSHLGAIMAGSKALAMQILAPLAFRSVFHSKMVP